MSGLGPYSRTPNFGYDLARLPEAKYYTLTATAAAGTFTATRTQAFTLTTNTEIQQSIPNKFGNNARPSIEFPVVASETTNLTLLNLGDDTAWDSTHEVYFPIDTMIDRIQMNFAMGLNVSARTAGNWAINGVTITLDVVRGNTTETFFGPELLIPQVGFSNLAAVGNQMMIVNSLIEGPIRVPQRGTLRMTVGFDPTVGTGTEQMGFVPFFTWQNTGGLREYAWGGWMLYSRPDAAPQTSTYQPTYYADFGGGRR